MQLEPFCGFPFKQPLLENSFLCPWPWTPDIFPLEIRPPTFTIPACPPPLISSLSAPPPVSVMAVWPRRGDHITAGALVIPSLNAEGLPSFPLLPPTSPPTSFPLPVSPIQRWPWYLRLRLAWGDEASSPATNKWGRRQSKPPNYGSDTSLVRWSTFSLLVLPPRPHKGQADGQVWAMWSASGFHKKKSWNIFCQFCPRNLPNSCLFADITKLCAGLERPQFHGYFRGKKAANAKFGQSLLPGFWLDLMWSGAWKTEGVP